MKPEDMEAIEAKVKMEVELSLKGIKDDLMTQANALAKMQSSRDSVIEREIEHCMENRPEWRNAHDGMFTCRSCGRALLDELRSWTRKGCCQMCAGDLPSEKPINKEG